MNYPNFEILVQSAPLGKQIGIHWRNAKDPNQSRVDFVEILGDPCLPSRDGRPNMRSIESVINKTKPSVLFGQHKNKIFLFVAGISGREISVAISQASRSKLQENVLWMIDKDEPDSQLYIRYLAAYAVAGLLDPHSDLQTLIRDAIDFDSEDKDIFTIDTPKLQQIYAKAYEQFGKSEATTQLFPSQPNDYDQSSLENLAKQIASCSVPDHETIVIVAERKQTANNGPYLKYQGNIIPSVVSVAPEPYSQVPDPSQDFATQKQTEPSQAEPSPKVAKKKDTISSTLPPVSNSSSSTGSFDSHGGDGMVSEPSTATGDRGNSRRKGIIEKLSNILKERIESSNIPFTETELRLRNNLRDIQPADLQGMISIMLYFKNRLGDSILTSQDFNRVYNYACRKLSMLKSQNDRSTEQVDLGSSCLNKNQDKSYLTQQWMQHYKSLGTNDKTDISTFLDFLIHCQGQNCSRNTDNLAKWLEDIQVDSKCKRESTGK